MATVNDILKKKRKVYQGNSNLENNTVAAGQTSNPNNITQTATSKEIRKTRSSDIIQARERALAAAEARGLDLKTLGNKITNQAIVQPALTQQFGITDLQRQKNILAAADLKLQQIEADKLVEEQLLNEARASGKLTDETANINVRDIANTPTTQTITPEQFSKLRQTNPEVYNQVQQAVARGEIKVQAQNGISPEGIINTVQDIVAGDADLAAAASQAARILNNIPASSILKTGKSADVKREQEQFDSALDLIRDEIKNVKLGKDPAQARANIILAAKRLSEYREAQQGIGRLNLDYWSDVGASYQEYLNDKISELESLQSDLILAEQQGITNQARQGETFA